MNKRHLAALRVVASFVVAAAPHAAGAQVVTSAHQSSGDTVRAPAPTDTVTLDRAIRVGLDRNRDVRAARYALEEARQQANEAWSTIYPQVDLNASYTRNISPTVTFLPAQIFDPSAPPGEMLRVQFGADNVWSTTIGLEQPLFQARAFLGVGAAGRFRALQEEVLRGATQSAVTRIRLSYYDVLLAQEQTRLLESSVERVRASLRETRAMKGAGLASEYDVLRLEVELANLEPNVRRARNALTQSRRNLAVEVGAPEIEHSAVVETLMAMDVGLRPDSVAAGDPALAGTTLAVQPLPPVDVLLESATRERSDLRQLELTRSLRRTQMRVEQLEYAPRISLFASYSIAAQENGAPNFFGESSLQRGYGRLAGIKVSMPIFTGFREHARIGQRRAVVRSVETQMELTRDRAAAEVRSLTERVTEAAERAGAQRLAVRQAQRGFEIVGAQYREGISGRLERTDAEVALRQSEFNYAQAIYDYLVARAQLDQATGGVPTPTADRRADRGPSR